MCHFIPTRIIRRRFNELHKNSKDGNLQKRKGIQKNGISSLRRDAEHEPIMIRKRAKTASVMQQGEHKTGHST